MSKVKASVQYALSRMKTRLIFTYIIIILLSVTVLRFYVLSAMSACLYNDNKVTMMTKINIIATDIADIPDSEIGRALDEDVVQLSIGKNNRILVINTDAKVIYDNTVNVYANSTGKVRVSPMILTALSGESSYRKVESGESADAAAAVPIMKNGSVSGVVYMETSADEIVAVLNDTSRSINFLTVLLCLIAVGLSFAFAGIFTAPITKLNSKIKAQSRGQKMKIDVEAKGEIGELVNSFNELIGEVDELEEKRTAFVSNASHELKTPLASIKLICDSILSAGDVASPEMVREFLGDMNEEVDRLTAIINDLLDLTRMDAAAYDTKKTFVTANLREVVGGVAEALSKIADQSGVTLRLEAHTDIFMLMEENKIWEAVYNVTDNAIKYTPYGGTVELFLEKDVANAIITVSDSGIGISKDEIGKIFDRFYRVDKARSRETGGTGLGLSIALSAVEMHGGHIDVESEEGKGSIFRIYLPIA